MLNIHDVVVKLFRWFMLSMLTDNLQFQLIRVEMFYYFVYINLYIESKIKSTFTCSVYDFIFRSACTVIWWNYALQLWLCSTDTLSSLFSASGPFVLQNSTKVSVFWCLYAVYVHTRTFSTDTKTLTLSWSFEEQRAHLLRIMRIMYLLSIVKAVMHSNNLTTTCTCSM
jgi:hypothetical protein